jgi:hypothetical protein
MEANLTGIYPLIHGRQRASIIEGILLLTSGPDACGNNASSKV